MIADAEYAMQTHARYIRTSCIVFLATTPFFLAIRFIHRKVKRSRFGLDDATLITSYLCAVVDETLLMVAVKHGFGKHIAVLSPSESLNVLKLFYVAQIFYKLTINLTKIAMLLLYLRVFPQQWFRSCTFGLIAIVLIYLCISSFVSIFQCRPVRGAWDKSIDSKCVSLPRTWFANAAFSIATDVLILLLPMHPIQTSKLPENQKRALIVVFLMGFIVTITSILRATVIDMATSTHDITYDIASTLWIIIEQNVAVICACLPMCRVVLAMALPSIFGCPRSLATLRFYSQTTSTGRYKRTGSFRSPSARTPHFDWATNHSGDDGGRVFSHNANVTSDHSDDNMSAEYILTSGTSRGLADEQGGIILKTMKYEVSHEDPLQKGLKTPTWASI